MAVGAAAAAIVASTAVGVASANKQADAAKRARKGQEYIQQQYLDFQRKQYKDSERFRNMTFDTLRQASQESDFGLIDKARSRVQDALQVINPELAKTGNLRSGVAQDLTLRETTRQIDALELERFNRQLGIAGVASGQGTALVNSANSLTGAIAGAQDNISNLILARGAANPYGPISGGLGQLGTLGLLQAGGFFGSGSSVTTGNAGGAVVPGLQAGPYTFTG